LRGLRTSIPEDGPVDRDNVYTELVLRIRQGDEVARDRLAACVRGPLQAYVYRITMRDDLTQDIVQESMLEMLKILGKLNEADRFWPWLCKIAMNKVRNHYRIQGRRKRAVISKANIERSMDASRGELENLVAEEFKQIVRSALDMLQPRHRAVLSMRCYENMSYAQIASIMEASELNVRLMFYRGKRQLERHLSRHGFGRGALLSALVVFGKMTAPDSAAAAGISVAPSMVEVGAVASAIGLLTTKAAVVSLAAAGIMTAGAIMTVGPSGTAEMPIVSQSTEAVSATANPKVSASYEHWHYFPEGAGGPVMTRLVQVDDKGHSSCQWLENDSGSYRYETGSGIVHVANHRSYNEDFSVRRLPTDRYDLTAFLNEIEGRDVLAGRLAGQRGSMLVVTSGDNMARGRLVRDYDVLQEEHFKYSWPGSARNVDERDEMHVQGYCGFTVSGELGGHKVEGTGCLPLYHGVSRLRPARVSLKVGGVGLIDNGSAAYVVEGDGQVRGTYAGGTFLRGLSRPWMGLHTLDTVRRDAAEQKSGFATYPVEGGRKAQVVLKTGADEIVYSIDMRRDVIESIAVRGGLNRQERGRLDFAYSADANGGEEAFVMGSTGGGDREFDGLWVVELARNGDLRRLVNE